MTEQTPETTSPIVVDEAPFTVEDRVALEERVAAAEKVADDARKAAAKASGDDRETHYAAYDEDYLRYVPGTFTTSKDARAAAKDAGVTRVRIDEV